MFLKQLAVLARSLSSSIHTPLPTNSKITRIRIWKSGYFNRDDQFIYSNVFTSLYSQLKPGRQPNIGHVSIETRELYASLWPDGIDLLNKLKPQTGDAQSSSPKKDEQAEGRPPDILVDLQTLDVEKIQAELVKFVSAGSTYHIIGSNKFFKVLRIAAVVWPMI